MTYNPNLADKLNRIVELEERLARAKRGKAEEGIEDETTIQPLITPASINQREYLQIPGTNTIISYLEAQGYNSLNWNDTHFKLSENGLYMPAPESFMKHFVNVLQAYQKKTKLYYADGTEVEREKIEDLYKHLTTNHISAYQGGSEGAWTNLDALFTNENSKWFIKSNHRVVNGKLVGKKEQLEQCLTKDCFAELEFNKQGLAIKESKKQEYNQGKNIRFWYPRDKTVAWFGVAVSGRAGLVCVRDPSDWDSALGVFACAEGAQT